MSRPGTLVVTVSVAVLCLIWGTTWSVIQVGLRGIPPFSGVALRFGIAAAVILGTAAWRGIPLGTTRRERSLWVANTVLAFCGSYGILYWSEQWVPSGLAAVLFATYPLFLGVLAHFLLPDEMLSLREIAGILVAFAGVGIIFSADFGALGGQHVAVAAAVTLIAPLISALASVIIKRWGRGVHPFSLAGVPMALTAFVMGALALGLERQRAFSWDRVAVASLLYLALAGSAVTFSLYYWLLSHLPAKRLAFISYVVPVVAVGVGTLRGEPLTVRMLIGSMLVVLGVALGVRSQILTRGGLKGDRSNFANSRN